MPVIVVGVDGSEDSMAAVRFAATEAALHDATLRVVCAWHIPTTVYAGSWAPSVDMASTFEGGRPGGRLASSVGGGTPTTNSQTRD
jgi:hypothetical protein